MHKRFLRDGDLDRIIITLKKEFNGKNNENITVAKGGVCLDSMVILFERSRKTLIKVEKYIGLWKTKDIQTYNTLCHVASMIQDDLKDIYSTILDEVSNLDAVSTRHKTLSAPHPPLPEPAGPVTVEKT